MNEVKPKVFYRLRWRFDFASKPSKHGVWDLASAERSDAAWQVNKTGLVRAVIEGESILSSSNPEQRLVTLFECLGDDFVSVQGEAFARIPKGGFVAGSSNPITNVYGITFITREERVTVVRDGSIIRRPLTDEEKNTHIHEHTAGA